jgi:hypothetical protein
VRRLAFAAGCGGGDGGPVVLGSDDALQVAQFNTDVAFTDLDGSGYGDLLESMDAVIAIARRDPEAVYETTDGERRTMRQVLSDAASRLQDSQPDLAAELDRAVGTLGP